MRFSVVIPLYNKAPFVRAAVASALGQSLAPNEVIVVDDGSTDGGLPLLAGSLRDDRLRLVRQTNRGVSAARNLGIALAQGDWVALLDADDQWHPNFLAALARAHRHCPAADLLATRFRRLADAPVPVPLWAVPDRPAAPAGAGGPCAVEVIHDLRRRWMRHAPLCASSVAVRAARLRRMSPCFQEGESYGEDLDMWFRLADEAPVAAVDAPYVTVRGGVEGALSRSVARTMPPFLLRMRAQALDGTLPRRLRASALWFVAQAQVTMAREALAEGARAEAVGWLARACQGTQGWRLRRWWITLALTLLMPAPVADRWQRWRLRGAEDFSREAA